MNGAELRSSGRDDGFTLPELLIAIVITSTIVTVLAMTIVTSMKTAPSVSNRADTRSSLLSGSEIALKK